MPAVGALYPTLTDIIKRTDPDGAIHKVVESLEQVNPFMQDIAWQEGNLPTGHRFASRTSLPSLTWRRFNQGIVPSKSTTNQVDETCGLLTGLAKIDCDEAELNGNSLAFRASEDAAFRQSFPNEMMRALLYESVATNPERIHGLTPRLNFTTGNPAANQILKGDATAAGNDQTSVWLIGWSPATVFGIYPKGSRGGIQMIDRGAQLTRDDLNREFFAYVSEWKWKCGLAVKDRRYLVRVCNIDTSAWTEDMSAGAKLPNLMRKAVSRIFRLQGVQPVFYMNRDAFDMFNAQMFSKSVNFLEYIERGGERVPHYLGIPIRVIDALTSTESVVV